MKKTTLLIIVMLFVMLISSSCDFFKPSNNISVKNIYNEQKESLSQEKVEEQAEKMSDRLRENVQKNADRQFDEIMDLQKNLDSSPIDKDIAPEDYLNQVADNMRNSVWRVFIVTMGSLQSVAIPGGIVIALVLILLAIFLRRDRKKLKNCIIFIVLDVVIVLFILYSPAILWSLQK